MKIISVIGTRPQYIKHAAFATEVSKYPNVNLITVDTGQHYDANMSKVFIDQLAIPNIKYNLEIGSALHGEQTGKMMIDIEKILIDEDPSFLVVYGDTNSTLAGALVAAKLNIPILHIEAGMRNHNMSVPEEINRVIVDRLSYYCFAASPTALINLQNEGLGKNSYFVGDITIDLLKKNQKISSLKRDSDFYFATIHRPVNTNSKQRVLEIFQALNNLEYKVILALHPRTKNILQNWDIFSSEYSNIDFIDPVDYLDTIGYVMSSQGVITDSGSLQKEAYVLKKKCTTILEFTPWQETLKGSWNYLMFHDLNMLNDVLKRDVDEHQYVRDCFGNGDASKKILDVIFENA
jgi:UDP-GlcNAc3NAcA epimerase